jgi:DNA-binding IclR family transcriptional regulator
MVAMLSDAYQRELSVPDYLLGALERIASTTGETTYLAGWRNGAIRILGVAEGTQAVRVAAVPITGPYRDAHARAGGKVLLAYAPDGPRERYLAANPMRAVTPRTIVDPDEFNRELERTRSIGYATDDEEFLPGVCCISAPVLHGDVLIAVYSMSLPSQRFAQRRDELVKAILSIAHSVENAIARDTSEQVAVAT